VRRARAMRAIYDTAAHDARGIDDDDATRITAMDGLLRMLVRLRWAAAMRHAPLSNLPPIYALLRY
jgi:hypothetical protein